MEEARSRTRKMLYWLVMIGAVALALYFIVSQLFPHLISKFTGLLVSLFVVATGLFLRKKRS